MQHRWPLGSRFVLYCYMHWAQLLLCHPGDAPVIILIREVITQGDPLSMVLYGITLVLLEEDLRDADPTILSTFYADDAVFDGLDRQSATQLRLLMDQGPDRGYFPEPAKYLLIAYNPEKKELSRQEFEWAGLNLNCVDGSQYMGAYLGPMEELQE